ncbi:hypothetical protein KP509_1Z231600 [Ceratopteris richardii]|nr:hypothetical protein KP509_1Z231600 [Ceratopteris richardii]
MPPNKVVVCPGLSLSLGTGLGPGPPIMSEFMSGTLSQMIATSTSHQISKLAQVNSDWDTRSNRPFIYGGPSIFTSVFTPSSSNSDSRNFGDSMAGLSIGINPSAENLIPQFGTQHNNAFFSASHQRQRGAQLPATTLLQKAAVMGVTKSSFLFRKPMDLSSSSTEEFHLRETWAGVTSSSASRHPTGASPSGDRLNSNYYDRHGATGSSGFSPASYGGQDRTEASKDLSAGCSSSMASILHLGHNTEHERQGQYSLINESHRRMSGSIARFSDLDETQREEASETNRMTLDFLGIGSQNSSFEKGVERANLVAAGVRPDQCSASKDTSHGNIEGCNR